jgi:type II secretory pathway component PulC
MKLLQSGNTYVERVGNCEHRLSESDFTFFQVQEVIDALETQLDSKLNDAVRGVRVANGNCYVCLAEEDNAGTLLETGLILRGAKIKLEDVSRDSIIVAFSGVPHDVPDRSVARVVASYGTVTGEWRTRSCEVYIF